jgi:hypothetical protein
MNQNKIPVCQSCGMPMNKSEDFGTNADHSQNKEYCRFCFKDGNFTDAGITMEQKIEKNIQIAKQMGMPEEKAKEMAHSVIPTLKRWHK